MERASRVREQVEGFKGANELTSETSTPSAVWTSAKGVIPNNGTASRMNGKAAYAKISNRILAFSQLADFIIVQTISSVFTVSNADFFGSQEGYALLNEDGDTLLNEDGDTLTT